MSSEGATQEGLDGYKQVQVGPKKVIIPSEWDMRPIGELFDINAFNQPGVELGKNYTYGIFGRDGYQEKKEEFNKRVPLRPTIDESVIIGSVVYIDSYSNAITNITADLFYRIGNKRKFQIFVQSNTNRINKISKNYNENPEGELLALFNSLNLLEVAMNGGNAAEILALDTDSTVRVRFY